MKLHNVLIRPTDLFEEILRRKLISGGGGAVLQTVTGISPLTLLNVASKGIKSLTQFGKCEQNGIPTPSVPVDIKCNNGTLKMVDNELPTGYKRILGLTFNNNVYYDITGFKMRGSDTLRFSFKCSMSAPACNVLGAYDGSSSQSNYSLYLGNSASAKYLRYNGATYRSDADSDTQYDVVVTPTGSIGMKSDSTWTEKTFESNSDLCIGTTSPTATSSKMVGNIIGNVIVDGRLKLTPCERISDNTLGYYDTIGEAFYEPTGTGVVSMGYDGSHYELSVMGTPEVLTVSADGSETQTVSVQTLHAVGDYKDEQEIISGGVTHKVGVKVFDGTENWTRTSSGGGFIVFSVEANAHSIQGWSKITSLCTHFECYVGDVSPTYIAANAGKFWLNTSGQYFRFVTDGTRDLAQFKAFLAEQYANGTPVIIVYPLAETTTEQVTAQHLSARDTATITAQTNNISDITLEVQYWQKAE